MPAALSFAVFPAAAVLSAVSGATLVAPAYAAVDPTPDVAVVCDRGTKWVDFSTTSSSRIVTHAKYISVPKGGSVDVTSGVTKIATIKASVEFTSSATVSANVVIAELSGTVGVTLASSGEVTSQSSESVTYHMGAGQYAVFHGQKKFTGSWNGGICNTNGTHETAITGTALSWAVPAEGAASCSATYSSSSFEGKAKAYAC